MTPGVRNAITDVPGVRVGHVTIWEDEPDPPHGAGIARTGVTVILPDDPTSLLDRPIAAGGATLNAAGELTGSLQIAEWGVIETPVYLTGTMQVGRVFDGAISAALAADPRVGVDNVVIPVVGECDDSWLNDARTLHVTPDHVRLAIERATDGPVAQGAVGAGTGMLTLGWKGGIGTASRACPDTEATLGVLVLSNFGEERDLRVNGVEVGASLTGGTDPPEPAGSCIAVVITDAPLRPLQLQRVARRCGLGLARMGSVAHHGSGEIFLALSTTARGDGSRHGNREQMVAVPDRLLDELFLATVEATEEAVLNAMWAAPDVVGREGRLARGLPHDEVLALVNGRRFPSGNDA